MYLNNLDGLKKIYLFIFTALLGVRSMRHCKRDTIHYLRKSNWQQLSQKGLPGGCSEVKGHVQTCSCNNQRPCQKDEARALPVSTCRQVGFEAVDTESLTKP